MFIKLLKGIFILAITAIFIAAYLLYARQKKNIVSIVPYPYYFNFKNEQNEKAPILIIGDRMGKRLTLFKEQLAKQISSNLSKPIQIATITTDGLSMARVLNKIKNYGSLPFIVIYAGASQEYLEKRFEISDLRTIKKNFDVYDNIYYQTALTIWPTFSKFIYTPLNYVELKKEIIPDDTEYSIPQILKRNIFTYKLFEREAKELFTYIKEKNSYLIALTTPVNLEVAPKNRCSYKLDSLSEKSYNQMLSHIKRKDFKQAYEISKNLILIANDNALIHYMHGQISKSLAKRQEAKNSLEIAASLDCKNYRATPIYNSIIKKVANDTGSLVFDFHELVYSSWGKNVLFESEIYPQNLYYQKLVNILSIKIKKVLKL